MSASILVGSAAPKPYGIKALRQMREKRQPSERLSRKISQTYDYFVEKVDPIIGACITHLLCEQPVDILAAIVIFLDALRANEPIQPKISEQTGGRARRELKVFLATSIGPVIAKLVNRIAVEKPDDVVEFMLTEVKTMIDAPDTNPNLPAPVSAPNQQNKSEEKEKAPVQERNIQLAVLGLNGAGKSSILNMLQGKFDARIRPTIGFRPVSMMLSEETKIRFYDLGGGKKIRDIWGQYYHDVHGVIYVIDGTAKGDELQLTIETLAQTIRHEYLTGKPLLIFVNKQDSPDAMSVSDAEELLRSSINFPNGSLKFAGCSSFVPAELPDDFTPDERIEASLMTLLDNVLGSYKILNERVTADCKRKSEEEVRQRVAKERKVLKNKIASAFLSLADPEYVAAQQIEAEPGNIFSEEEGLTYLASEIGEDVPGLSDLAKQVAAFVGYQKLALTIIGGLKAPVSKKKVPMSWPEIHDMVLSLRKELGIL